MKFECYCKHFWGFQKLINNIRSDNWGVNYEEAARLWYTGPDNETIMIEYQVATLYCRNLHMKDEPVSDWFTAYAVENESHYDASIEIFTEEAGEYKNIHDLKNAMIEFANRVFAEV